jgi:formate C-acetyltransferase
MSNLAEMMLTNFEGKEAYSQVFSDSDMTFGRDDEFVIGLTNEISDFVLKNLEGYRNSFGGKIKFGLSSPAYVDKGKRTPATFDGRKNGEPFSTHISNQKGVAYTEIMHFAARLDYKGLKSNGNVVDIIVHPTLLKNDLIKFVEFLLRSIKLGFFQVQFNVVSYQQLIDAKANPNKYKGLIVRVWGFSAYFNDLPENFKDNLIARAREIECA